MSLKINLRHLDDHGIHLQGALPVAELDLGMTDELVHAEQSLQYDLSVESMHDAVLATGSLVLPLECECGRCLKKYQSEIKLTGWAVHLPLEGEEKVSVENDCIDLTPFVREDMLLNFPQHPLCKPDCAGMKKPSQKASEIAGDEQSKPAVWAELDKLKLK